jgi:hypothetical protein
LGIEETYEEIQSKLRPVRGEVAHEEELESRFRESGVCTM